MIGRKRKRLGDLLVDAGVVTSEQLGEALKKQRELGLKLGETLIELKFTDENEIVEALHQQMGYPVAKIREAKIAPEVISLLPETIVRKHNVVPFEVDPDNPNILRVAMADPMDIIAIDDLAIVTNMQIEAMVATPSDVRFGIERYYGNEQVAKMAETYSKERREQQNAREKQEEANEEVDNAPIVLLVNKIIEQAVNERASDIHIEPLVNEVRVRYRIDGELFVATTIAIEKLPQIVGRLKAISNMHQEIQESQDGRILLYDDYNIRVSSQRNVYGEKFVLRLLKKNNSIQSIFDLGYPGTPEDLDKSINKRNSITLIAAPTGEGKTTSLYSMLDYLNKPNINVTTIEDPVEIRIPGLNQIEVDPKSTFSDNLRTILRQDPDIILVGEIRDKETAEIAMQAGQTGHYVLSTIHTIDAVEVITRLRKIGISDYDISSTLATAISQRLVRKICPNCRKERPFNDQEKKIITSIGEKYGIKYDLDNAVTYDAVGCAKCNHSGYAGRIACFEILNLDEETKELIMNGASSIEIRKCALKGTYRPLLVDGINKVVKGITTLDELNRKLRVF